MKDLATYQKAHLSSLIDGMERTLVARKGNKVVVAVIEVTVPAERASALAGVVSMVDCIGVVDTAESVAPSATADRPAATYESYAADSGEVYWDDQQYNPSAPFLTNYFRFDDLSEFTGDHKSYEHDIKITPVDFTECRKTKTWNAPGDPFGAATDCRGPVSTNVPSTSSWYYDTRMGDQDSDQKDFTMGIRWANKLRTNYTYYFTVKVVSPSESEATMYLDRQLGGEPREWDEEIACNLYAMYIGRAAACTFAWANTGQDISFTLLEGEVVHETWSD